MSLISRQPENRHLFLNVSSRSDDHQVNDPQSRSTPLAPASQSHRHTRQETVTAHTLTRQADGRLHFEHIDNIVLPAYALQSGERESRGVQDRPLENNQRESVFNVSSKKTDPVTGHRVEASRRYLVQWREFPIQETWEKALTQPGYPPLKVVANPLDGGWTVEPNDFLRTMAQSIYFYRAGPEAPPLDKETGLRRREQLIWVDIDGQLFPVAEQKKTTLVPFSPNLGSFAPTIIPHQSPVMSEITEYFIKTPADKNIDDWPPLPIVRDKATGKWTPRLTPTHINSLLGLLGNVGLYGIAKHAITVQLGLAPGYTHLQVGKNHLRVANNISVDLPGVTLPAVVHHRGRLPPVPLAWDPRHKRYYILSDPQAFTRPTFTERETWGIRLMVLGIMMRDPINSSVDLIKAAVGDAASQERLAQLINSGVYSGDNSTGGKFAKMADSLLSMVFFAKSPKATANLDLISWIATAIGKALLKQEFTVDEILSAYQSLLNYRYNAEMPLQGQEQAAIGPALQWLESKVVAAPTLQQDRRYSNLWRHPEGKLYLKEPEQQLQYLPLIEENSLTFSELRPIDKGEGRRFTAGSDGQLREMTPTELQIYRAEQPTAQELLQRNFQVITFTQRDGSLGRGFAAAGNHAIKELYLFDATTRSFRSCGKSVGEDGRVIGLAGGGKTVAAGNVKSEERGAKNLLNISPEINVNYIITHKTHGEMVPLSDMPGLYLESHRSSEGQIMKRYLLKWDQNSAGELVWLNLIPTATHGVYRSLPLSVRSSLEEQTSAVLRETWPHILISHDIKSGVWTTHTLNSETFMDLDPSRFKVISPAPENHRVLKNNEYKLSGMFSDKQGRVKGGRDLVWAEAGKRNGEKVYVELERDGADNSVFWLNTAEGYRKYRYNAGAGRLENCQQLAHPRAKGYPAQLDFQHQGQAEVYFNDGSAVKIDISADKTLTENLLQHFDAIDDGIYFDRDKFNARKRNLFSINKINLLEEGERRTVYFPKEKYGKFDYNSILYDSVPINFDEKSTILLTPDKFNGEGVGVAHNMHVMRQGTMDSCGHTSGAMLLQDFKMSKGISDNEIRHFIFRSENVKRSMSSKILSEELSESGLTNNYHMIKGSPYHYLRERLTSPSWNGIVNINGHFAIITSAGEGHYYLRDPYQGILSLEKTERLNEYILGDDIIEVI